MQRKLIETKKNLYSYYRPKRKLSVSCLMNNVLHIKYYIMHMYTLIDNSIYTYKCDCFL